MNDYDAIITKMRDAFEGMTTKVTAADLATTRFAQSIEGLKMEELHQDLNAWANIPKRKRRFHMNAGKRAATNWNATLKMLKLLAPCGVQANAQALDIINAKYGL